MATYPLLLRRIPLLGLFPAFDGLKHVFMASTEGLRIENGWVMGAASVGGDLYKFQVATVGDFEKMTDQEADSCLIHAVIRHTDISFFFQRTD